MSCTIALSQTGSTRLPFSPLATEPKCNAGTFAVNLSAPKFLFRLSHDSGSASMPKKKGFALGGSPNKWVCHSPVLMSLPLFTADPAFASSAADVPHQNAMLNPAIGETSAILEASVQFLYLGGLLALLGFGSFLVVRQVLVKRELENAAKELQERVRTGQASSEECFELGAVMLRKKLYIQAKSYLGQAINKWDGEEQDLAQVYNALGFTYFSEENMDKAIEQYEKAIQLSPGYVVAWNNLGNAYEKKKDWQKALKAYENTLSYDPSNRVAGERVDGLRQKAERFKGIPSQPNSKR